MPTIARLASRAALAAALAGCGGTFPQLPGLPPPKVAVTPGVGQLAVMAGETQSTVVGPGLKAECPAGRLLITNDLQRPPQTGTVIGRNLDDLNGADVPTTFDSPPGAATDVSWQTNDHDISVLANGDVVLTFSVHLAGALSPKPGWFDQTFKNDFGPGVRRGVMTWRSTDCGQSFQWQSTIDPITLGVNGECANPQPVKDATLVDGAYPPPFANGGVDGNLAKVDLLDDQLYLVFQCTGNQQDLTKPDYELLDKGVNKTFVLRSSDEGQTWTTLGNLEVADWRIGVAALDASTLAFAQGGSLVFAQKAGNTYLFDGSGTQAPNGGYGWDGFVSTASPFDLVGANVWSSMEVFKSPGNASAYLLFPDTVVDGEGGLNHGARLFDFDRASQQWAEVAPIVPATVNLNAVVFHPTVIEAKGGPTLIYWYDLDGGTGEATIRGRFVYGAQAITNDFDVALEAQVGANPPAVHTFSISSPAAAYWYGDYHTGGSAAVDAKTWDYYPIWVEPDSTVRFAKVSATIADNPDPSFKPLGQQAMKDVVKAGARTPLRSTERDILESEPPRARPRAR